MITWKDTGEQSVAMLGNWQAGAALLIKGEWRWGRYLPDELGTAELSACGAEATLPAAKAALEAAVADWVRRAGLVSVPAGHVVVPRESTQAMRDACWTAMANNDDEVWRAMIAAVDAGLAALKEQSP